LSTEAYDLGDTRPTGRLNDRLPKWLQFGLDERFRLEGYPDAYLLNRFRFGMVLQPHAWFKIVGQVQDARSVFEKNRPGPPNDVRWDLKLAYVQLGDPEKNPVALTAGRQLIDFNSTLIANSEWRNQARSYDAVVTRIQASRFRAAVFAASVVNPALNGITHHQQGNNIYGAYGWIARVLPKSSIEPFALWRVDNKLAAGHLDEKAYGFRVRGAAIRNFDYRYEFVIERGRAGADDIRAWGTTAGLGYTAPGLAWRPRFFAGYDYASGDATNGAVRGTFDTMYPTAHDRFGIADQFGWQNIVSWRGGATVYPHRRWSVTAHLLDLWLASATDAAYNSSGAAILQDRTGKSGRHLGRELDAYTWYEINRQIHVGAGIGHLFAGELVARAGGRTVRTYPYFVIEMFDGRRVR
jgi:hypothetical protein